MAGLGARIITLWARARLTVIPHARSIFIPTRALAAGVSLSLGWRTTNALVPLMLATRLVLAACLRRATSGAFIWALLNPLSRFEVEHDTPAMKLAAF
jgi:hypothetical protein